MEAKSYTDRVQSLIFIQTVGRGGLEEMRKLERAGKNSEAFMGWLVKMKWCQVHAWLAGEEFLAGRQ